MMSEEEKLSEIAQAYPQLHLSSSSSSKLQAATQLFALLRYHDKHIKALFNIADESHVNTIITIFYQTFQKQIKIRVRRLQETNTRSRFRKITTAYQKGISQLLH